MDIDIFLTFSHYCALGCRGLFALETGGLEQSAASQVVVPTPFFGRCESKTAVLFPSRPKKNAASRAPLVPVFALYATGCRRRAGDAPYLLKVINRATKVLPTELEAMG